jgi:hypothetical protein
MRQKSGPEKQPAEDAISLQIAFIVCAVSAMSVPVWPKSVSSHVAPSFSALEADASAQLAPVRGKESQLSANRDVMPSYMMPRVLVRRLKRREDGPEAAAGEFLSRAPPWPSRAVFVPRPPDYANAGDAWACLGLDAIEGHVDNDEVVVRGDGVLDLEGDQPLGE